MDEREDRRAGPERRESQRIDCHRIEKWLAELQGEIGKLEKRADQAQRDAEMAVGKAHAFRDELREEIKQFRSAVERERSQMRDEIARGTAALETKLRRHTALLLGPDEEESGGMREQVKKLWQSSSENGQAIKEAKRLLWAVLTGMGIAGIFRGLELLGVIKTATGHP
jgi:hypothetical protein